MPNEKGYEENTGWYPIQVVSPRQVQPALEGNDRKEDTKDKQPRQTPNHGDKNSERPYVGFRALLDPGHHILESRSYCLAYKLH